MSTLEIEGAEVGFPNGFRVGPVSFSANSGVVHLAGPNGSGKTTLLRAFCGEVRLAKGSVRVNGRDVHRELLARKDIALVPARNELPEFLTVREAYEFTASLRGAPDWSGAEFCRALNIDPDLRLGHASDGQRRKAELIAALAGDPSILLMDETFASLDKDSAAQVAAWVAEWSAVRTVVLTHHGDLPVAVDQVVSVG
ncbi:MAG: ATP-binding cassette domain-containing protein [Pseudomonadota bacterium]